MPGSKSFPGTRMLDTADEESQMMNTGKLRPHGVVRLRKGEEKRIVVGQIPSIAVEATGISYRRMG